MTRLFICAFLGMAHIGAAPAQEFVPAWIAVDGFENGPVSAYRLSDIRLRDPHVFAQVPVFGCRDFTDTDIPLAAGSSFNAQLNAPLNQDNNGDGFVDSSTLLLLRPLDLSGRVARIDTVAGQCSFPLPSASCTADPAAVPSIGTYQTVTTGTCLAPLAGTIGAPAYTPSIASASAICLTGPASDGGFSGNGLTLPLLAVRLAAQIQSTPNRLEPGLIRGFLTETAANSILLPANLPLIGGQPLSQLLPGGAGNCSARNDKDMLNGQPGWWFYFNIVALPVPFTDAATSLLPAAAAPSFRFESNR